MAISKVMTVGAKSAFGDLARPTSIYGGTVSDDLCQMLTANAQTDSSLVSDDCKR
jgi:hypothetical protein